MKKMSKIRLNRNAGNDKMEKADRTPLTKWEKVLLYLQILAILLLCVSVFFMLIDINQQYGFWEIVQITTATLAIFWCFVMFILVNEEKKYVL